MQQDDDGEERVTICVVWKGIAGVDDGASDLFTVSPTLNAEQIALLPPPVSVRYAQFDLSKGAIGAVYEGVPLDGGVRLAELLRKRNAGDVRNTSYPTFELSPLLLLREKYGDHVAQPASTPTASPVKTRHMTSVQLIEHLRANGVEPPDGLGTPRSVLRQLAADLEGPRFHE